MSGFRLVRTNPDTYAWRCDNCLKEYTNAHEAEDCCFKEEIADIKKQYADTCSEADSMLSEIKFLRADCQKLEMAKAEAMALVMSHEGHIAKLEKRGNMLEGLVTDLLTAWEKGDYSMAVTAKNIRAKLEGEVMDRCYYCGDYIINEDGKGCLCDRARENTIRLEARVRELEAELAEWKNRMNALVGEDSPSTAGNKIIDLRARHAALVKAAKEVCGWPMDKDWSYMREKIIALADALAEVK